MCDKIISKSHNRNIDSCLIKELEDIKEHFPRFKEKFKMIMSCCGHGKYAKTLVVQNRASLVSFEWFSGVSLEGTKRSDSKEPFYKRDPLGHYYIPEVEMKKIWVLCWNCGLIHEIIKVIAIDSPINENDLECEECKSKENSKTDKLLSQN